MNDRIDHNSTRYHTPLRTWMFLLGICLLFGALIWWATGSYKNRLIREVYHDAKLELTTNASSLTLTLGHKFLLASGLKAFAETELSEESQLENRHFDDFASGFISSMTGVRNLSLYPDGVAKYVYPLKGNEQIIGVNLFTHSDLQVRQNAERTKQTSSMTILGPFELVQGGLGILTRQSISQNHHFWGFASVVLDIPPILQEAGLLRDKGIDLAVRAGGKVLLGDPKLFDKHASTLYKRVPLADGYWELAAMPKMNKLDSIISKVCMIRIICSFALLLLLAFLYVQMTQKGKLQVMVRDRTTSLVMANQQLEATYEELIATEEELREQYELLGGSEKKLRHMAYHDTVTGLHNRDYFQERLSSLLVHAKPTNRSFALFFIDLDHFKMINDTLGHAVGDILLQQVGQRLSSILTAEDIFSRIGGDEFTIILPKISDIGYVQDAAQAIIELFQEPFILQGMEYDVTASIGVTLYPEHSEDATTLIKYADAAMYKAKDEGKNNYRIYDSSLNPDAEERLEIKNSLRHAVDRNELTVHYQPQIEVGSGRILGLEALIRWNHPKRGLLMPGSFIAIAEETGLIVPIGEWVLRTVCSQSKRWQEAGLPPVRVAVNLSARQFAQNQLSPLVQDILTETGLDPAHLELEITESMAMQDRNWNTLAELKQLNITISIDDFGTHYSSLSYLKHLPVNKIKIDRSFVNGIAQEPKDEAIIMAMLLVAHRLNLTILAEGVETYDQFSFLHRNQCDEIQGYLFYKPQSAEQIEHILRQHSPEETLNRIKG
ncbi:EAL domain-containing protein [Paenibacillus solisilvae]|uniref:EAL domain-containing protein n=1 Tax=Paenibacillus solisilvae TaxID=2486751 RepID=A0ABW0W3L7_9BACL